MAKRRFELPGVHELSKEQERVFRLPLDGRHLVIGGPGTGKSVVALLRTRRHLQYRDRGEYIFLVYNVLLNAASSQLFDTQLNSKTWITWFKEVFRRILGRETPMQGGSLYNIDWDAVKTTIATYPGNWNAPPIDFIIIDEGQDMPKDFYTALMELGCKHFFVVADQNQTITEQHCSRKELEDALGIEHGATLCLTSNYRNSYPVARLAKEFYPDDPASPPVELPLARRSVKTPLRVEYGGEAKLSFNGLIRKIVLTADRDPSKLIGVIAPDNIVREKYYTEFMKALNCTTPALKLDNEKPKVTTYKSGDKYKYPFDEGGIFVINAASCKGLEFEIVFIADIHAFQFNYAQTDMLRRKFYVMVSRAKEQIFLLQEAGRHIAVESILPKDESILAYWR